MRISLAVLVCPKQSVGVQKSSDATGIAHPCAVIWTVHPRLRDLVPWTNKLSTRVRAKSRLLAGPGTVCPATREPSACSKVRPCQRSLGAASHGADDIPSVELRLSLFVPCRLLLSKSNWGFEDKVTRPHGCGEELLGPLPRHEAHPRAFDRNASGEVASASLF